MNNLSFSCCGPGFISLCRMLLPHVLWVPPPSRLELQPKCATIFGYQDNPPRIRRSSKNRIPAGWNVEESAGVPARSASDTPIGGAYHEDLHVEAIPARLLIHA